MCGKCVILKDNNHKEIYRLSFVYWFIRQMTWTVCVIMLIGKLQVFCSSKCVCNVFLDLVCV
jgi:hypothetical protein